MINNGQAIFIDPQKDPRWDAFVSGHPSGWLTHLSGWTQVLEKSFPKLKGYHIVLPDASGEAIRALLPTFLVKSWRTGARLVSVPLGTICGPLTTTANDLEPLIDAVLNLAANLGASAVELRTRGALSALPEALLGKSDYFRQHCLALENGPELLFKSFHRSCVRQKINRALNSGLKLKIGESPADMREFYRLYLRLRKRLGLPPTPYVFCEMLWNIFYPKGQLQLLLAQDGEQIPAGLLLFKFNGRVSAEILANDDSSKEKSPNHFLFWHAIQLSCAEGYRIFDFGRTSPDHDPLMSFKERWGTRVEALPTYYYPGYLCGCEQRAVRSSGRRAVNAVCRHAPEWLLKQLGRLYYGHFM
jgi:hypothetical protein